MQFLIDTKDGKTIEAELGLCGPGHYFGNRIDVDGVPCVLSTARSLEAEAVKDATAIIRESLVSLLLLDDERLDDAREWLAKWGRE